MRQHWLMLSAGFVFMLLQNWGLMKTPVYIKKAVDEITSTNRIEVIRGYFAWILVFTFVTVISLYLMRRFIISVSRKIEYQLRDSVFNKLMSLDYLFYQENETGDLVSRSTNDLNDVRTLLGPGVMYVPNSLSRFMIFLPVLFGLSSSLVMIVTLLLALLVVIIVILIPRQRPLFQKVQELAGKISNLAWQVISGISTIKLNSLENNQINRFKDVNREYIKQNMAVVKYREGLWPFFFFVFSLTELIILLLGGKQVIAGTMSIGELFQFNIMIASLTFPVLSLGWIMSLMQQGITAMTRINYILDYPMEQQEGLGELEGHNLTIKVKNLNYKYPNSAKYILNDINMVIDQGHNIGITGMIGSGKSTLLMLLNGLLKPPPGTIFINDMDIGEMKVESLNSKISVVSQDPFLFSKTLRDNISLGLDDRGREDLARIEGASKDAGLHKDILTFPNRYDQIIGERGITLSGGQKQRVAIARSLIRNTPILLLDDPLSNVDATTEEKILGNLKTLNPQQTRIIVSHRISALKDSDMIYVMDEGRVIERGTHESLMRKRGLYSRLALMQQMEVQLESK